jgi:hypothetical protein
MVEIIDTIQGRESAKAEVPIGPEDRKLWSPIRRQRCRLFPRTIEQIKGQSALRNHSDIDVAVTLAESAMGKAADEIDSQEVWSECCLPEWDEATGEIQRGQCG